MAIIRVSYPPVDSSNFVDVTSNQDIIGLKDFQIRPTVTDVPVAIESDLTEIKKFSIAMAIALS